MIRAAMLCTLLLSASTATALPIGQERALFDRIERAMKSDYVFPDKVPAIVSGLRAKAARGAYRGLDEKAFAKQMSADLRALAGDGHMQLRYFPEGMPKDETGRDDPSTVAAMHREGQRDNWGVKLAEAREGGVGILRIDIFYAPGDAAPAIGGAMQMLHDTDALVLDLRHCHGGEPETVAGLLSHFLPPRTHLNSILGRGGKVNSELFTGAVAPAVQYDKPVFVVIGRQTASACEEAAYDLQALKRATIVGERSFGAANPGDMRALDGHFALFVPNEEARNPVTGGNWEGSGVQPDVEVADDGALDRAVEMAASARKS